MDYTVRQFVGERLDGTENWKNHPLAALKDYARQTVEIGYADRVEILIGCNVMFEFPEARDRA